MEQEQEKVNMEDTEKTEKKHRKEDNLIPFKPGQSGNPAGRPKGSISPITRIRQIFEESPEAFEQFIKGYMEDPDNRKHLVEMLDGKPKQALDISGQIEEKQIRELVLTTRKILELKESNEENK